MTGQSFRFVRASGRGEAACGREGHEFQRLVVKMKSFPPALLLLLAVIEQSKYPGFCSLGHTSLTGVLGNSIPLISFPGF